MGRLVPAASQLARAARHVPIRVVAGVRAVEDWLFRPGKPIVAHGDASGVEEYMRRSNGSMLAFSSLCLSVEGCFGADLRGFLVERGSFSRICRAKITEISQFFFLTFYWVWSILSSSVIGEYAIKSGTRFFR